MKTPAKSIALTLASFLVLASLSTAQVLIYEFNLSGLQENPPVITAGTGEATVTLDTNSFLLTWDVTYQDLSSGVTLAHFHGPAAPGSNASPFVNMAPTTGATSGTMLGDATLTETQAQWIMDGLAYINIHTEDHGGGELRGQVVPEPGTYALFAGIAALTGVVIWRRRIRR